MVIRIAENGERRRFSRVPFETRVVVKNLSDGAILRNLDSRDISMKGMYCFTGRPFEPGTPCGVELQLTGTSSELWLRIEGKVARKDKCGMAVVFDSMDLDAFIHLKNVLYYNSGDPESIEREIIKYKPRFGSAPQELGEKK